MSTNKYQIWFNYDNDKTTYMLPVLPEEISIKYKGLTQSVEIDKLGEIIHKGKRGAGEISFSSFFPAIYIASLCCPKSKWKSPKAWINYIKSLMGASNPVHFVLTGGPMAVNMYAVITSFECSEKGGDVGTVHYSITLKEYRTVSVSKVKIGGAKKAVVQKPSSKPKRTSNQDKSKLYKVKRGDCLWNIARKYYGSGNKWTKIYNANKSAIEKDAKKHGFSSSNHGNRIWPGLKLKIPK